jgi:hypothetical protein
MFSLLAPMDKFWVWVLGVATAAACVFAILEVRWWSEHRLGSAPGTHGFHAFYRIVICMFGTIVLFGAAGWFMFEYGRNGESGITTAYRSVFVTSGISPVLSLVALLFGFYWWFWQALSGLALLGDGRPALPASPVERQTSRGNQMAESIEQAVLPFPNFGRSTLLTYVLPLFLVLLLCVMQSSRTQGFDMILHSLESAAYGRTLQILIGIALYLILLECFQFYFGWLVLKRLLKMLDRVPLRRTFGVLQGLSMGSLWRLSSASAGSRARAKIFARQIESLGHLRSELDRLEWRNCGTLALRQSVCSTWETARAYRQRGGEAKDLAIRNDPAVRSIRMTFVACSQLIIEDLLLPEWNEERGPLATQEATEEDESSHQKIVLSDNLAVRQGEEFICLIYVEYLQNMLGRMRTMVLSMVGVFAAIALAVGLDPFTPRPTISLLLLLLLLLIGVVVGTVFAGLDRDSTLSRITHTKPGDLGTHFWIRMLSFIGVPALGLIVSQFPEITDFVFSWIAPTMDAAK